MLLPFKIVTAYYYCMDYALLATTYSAISGFILGIGTILQITLNDDLNKRFGKWLSEMIEVTPRRWVRRTNEAFLKMFDWLYGGQQNALEETVWVGYILTFLGLVGGRVAILSIGATWPSTELALVLALLLALGISLFRFGSSSYVKLIDDYRRLCLTIRINTWSRRLIIPVLTTILGGTILGISAILYTEVVEPTELTILGELIFRTVGNYVQIADSSLIAIITALIAFLLSTPIAIGLSLIRIDQIPVNPVKATLSSLIFIVLIGTTAEFMLPGGVLDSILEGFKTDGLIVLGFITFNVFADSFSLVETRWILRRAMRASFSILVVLLIVDFLFSAAFFLFLPFVLDQITFTNLLDVILLRESQRLLGILFWTTFSTSFVFYLFVLSSFVIRPMSKVPLLGQHLQVERLPVFVLTGAVLVVITVLFWGSVGVVAMI